MPARTRRSPTEVPLQPASLDIWDKKYRLKTKDGQPLDDSPEGTNARVARALAETERHPEEWYEKFLFALNHGAIPAGRIISNAGAREHKPATSTINCTVSGTVRDSMDDILTMVHEAGLTLKAGCGIGYEFSTLRPKGAFVAGAGASTSGPLSFMDIFDAMCRTISSAGGRRGAQMATFDISHPDILDFIRAKRSDGRLRQFNLSCLISAAFMEAVKNDLTWELVFPANRHELADPATTLVYRPWPVTTGYQLNDQGEVACKVYRSIPARRLWNAIMAATYDFAEPGFILIDRVNTMNNLWWCEEVRATNPCVTGDTWVHTSQGARQVEELVGVPFVARLAGGEYPSTPAGFFPTGVKPVVRLTTSDGFNLRLTGDHRVLTVSKPTPGHPATTTWKPAAELLPGEEVVIADHRATPQWEGPGSWSEGYLLGMLLGDGTLKSDEAVLSVWHPPLVVNGNGPREDAGESGVMAEVMAAVESLPHRADFRGWHPIPGRNESRLSTAAVKRLADQYGMTPGNKRITKAVERGGSEFGQGMLRGLFDCDGSVQGEQRKGVSVRLAQSEATTLQAVQRMLLRLGIGSKIYWERRPAGTSLLPDGKGGARDYQVRAQHELVISGENLERFAALVGFSNITKAARLHQALRRYRRRLNRESFTTTVVAVTPEGEAPVYDVQIPGINAFDANGITVHNCGEQPLPPYGACLLGSINLTRFVVAPFTSRVRFDWERYRTVVRTFTRMLDNVVELHGLPLPGQAREIEHKRRHGMGYLGLGSAITMLGMVYGDDASVEFTAEVTRVMAAEGWEVGIELAREKGPAPIMEELFVVDAAMLARRPELARDGYKLGDQLPGKVLLANYSRYLEQFPAPLRERIAKYGCRFTHHTSIAPTGTIALSLANNASNGIEPSFAHKYSRNVIREGKKSKEKVDVYSYELLAYRTLVNPGADVYATESTHRPPENFIDAAAIAPRDHVRIQAAAQQWIDSSISKTINVPTDFPFDAFKDVYLYAYEMGLKGCTTFRFNPEAFQGVLVKEDDLAATTYQFTLEDGTTVKLQGNEEVEYDGELHTAANLFDALKEGYYGRY